MARNPQQALQWEVSPSLLFMMRSHKDESQRAQLSKGSIEMSSTSNRRKESYTDLLKRTQVLRKPLSHLPKSPRLQKPLTPTFQAKAKTRDKEILRKSCNMLKNYAT
jgi:hypothetical protein